MRLGVPIEQPWLGVDTSSLSSLGDSLEELKDAYPKYSRAAREEVIAAKDRLRFAANNLKAAAEKRVLKAEMVEWMLVWLDDPAMFADWVKLRRAVLTRFPAELGKSSRAKPTPP